MVPTGYVAVVRDIDCYVAADITGAITVRLIGNAGQTIFFSVTDVDTSTNPQWRGRQVFFEGEHIELSTTGPGDMTVSGYLLALP